MRNRTLALATSLGLALAPGLEAQDDAEFEQLVEEIAAAVPWSDQTSIRNYQDEITRALTARSSRAAARIATEKAWDITEQQPGTVGAPDGFGSRLGEAFTNFLPLLGFAMDAVNVSDDEKSLIVDFNPLRTAGYGAIKLNATISEPVASQTLLDEVVESARAAQDEAIRDSLGDFADVTWTLTYGYQRQATGNASTLPRRPWRWGRHPSLYQPYIVELMDQVWSTVNPASAFVGAFWEDLLANAGFSPLEEISLELTAARVRNGLSGPNDDEAVVAARFEELRRRVVAESIRELEVEERLQALELETIGHLIDNQPQLLVTAAYRDRDALIGPETYTATVKAELGINNFNRLLRRAAKDGSLLTAYHAAVDEWDFLAKDRFTFSLTWLERDDHHVSFDYLVDADDPASARTVSLDTDGSRDLCGKVQYSRTIKRQPVEIEGETIFPRLDFSMEYVDVADDPARQDRWVAQLGYSFPVRDGLSIPLTLSYANHSEFLGDPDEQLSAHLGLSYGLDRLFPGGDGD